jgi:hypothetical protein
MSEHIDNLSEFYQYQIIVISWGIFMFFKLLLKLQNQQIETLSNCIEVVGQNNIAKNDVKTESLH